MNPVDNIVNKRIGELVFIFENIAALPTRAELIKQNDDWKKDLRWSALHANREYSRQLQGPTHLNSRSGALEVVIDPVERLKPDNNADDQGRKKEPARTLREIQLRVF